MRILVFNGYSQWGAWSPDDLDDPSCTHQIAGGETASIRLSEGLAKAGHQVIVFYDTARPGKFNGVDYVPTSMFKDLVMNLEHDVLVSWETPSVLEFTKRDGRLVIYAMQNNHLEIGVRDVMVDWYQAVSEWHATQLFSTDKTIDLTKFVIIPNGVTLSRYANPLPKQKNKVIYTSSPDRGLHHLLRIWPRIRKELPDAELHVMYEFERWYNLILQQEAAGLPISTGSRAHLVKAGLEECKHLGLVSHGALGWSKVVEHQLTASLHVYTCDPIQPTEGYCALPDTPIPTPKGLRNIQDVPTNSQVLGQDGIWHNVVKRYERLHKGKIMSLRVHGWPEPLRVTPEHPVLVAGGGTQRKWIPAGEKPKHVAMVIPTGKPAPSVLDLTKFDPVALKKAGRGQLRIQGDTISYSQNRITLPREIAISPELCELLGWYLAEGTASLATGCTTFSLGSHEVEHIERIKDIVWDIWGLKCGFFRKDGKAQVKIHSKLITRMFHEIGGYGAHHKHMPPWYLGLSQECRQALLVGLYRGDGYVRRGSDSAALTLTTVSRELAYGTRLLLLQERCWVNGSYSKKRDSWEIGTNVRRAPWLARAMGCEVENPREPAQPRSPQTFRKDGLIRFKAKWTEEEYSGPVYDLSVSGSHSYVAGPIVIHNSCSVLESMAAGTPVILSDADAFPELWGDCADMLPLPINDDEWAGHIIEMLTNQEKWQAASEKGKEVAEQLDWADIGASYAKGIEVAVAKRRE